MDTPDLAQLIDRTDPVDLADRQQFADSLNRLREHAGLTVRDLARVTGIPHSTLGGYLTGRHLPPVSQPELLPDILRACGVKDQTEVDRWCQALVQARHVPGPRPADAAVPYRGLASFQPEDAEWFFGRHHLTLALVERLAERWAAGGDLVTLVGPSGSGKSSLLRAGVISALREGAMAGGASATWPVLLLHPGRRPLAALASELSSVTERSAETIASELRADPTHCALLARRAGGPGAAGRPGCLVIVVDQFEEVFTECTDDAERQLFLTALQAAATAAPPDDDGAGHPGHPAAAVLLGLRADFYHRALREPLLVTALQRAQFAIGPMDEAELRQAIVAPARKAGLEVEDGLVELLLRDLSPPAGNGSGRAAHEAGALPLLSHALRATWDRGTRWRLTVADYEAVGAVRGAVARSADAVFESLGPAEQEMAGKLFVRLVRVSEDAPNTRQRIARHELETLVDVSGHDALNEVLDRFVGERLITVDANTVEITHEALVAAWPRLRNWIAANRNALLVAQRLEDDARQWRRAGRDPEMLYQGARLAAVQEATRAAAELELTGAGREFLQASARRERRRVRRLYETIAALAALLLLAVTVGVYAVEQRREALVQSAAAAKERNVALSQMVAVRSDRLRTSEPALAGQLALVAYGIEPTAEARSSLLSSSGAATNTRILGPTAVMQDIAFHPGQNLLVAATDDNGGLLMWDVADRHRPEILAADLLEFEGVVHSVSLRPDGQVLAAGGSNPTVRLFDLTDPAQPVVLSDLTGPVDTIETVAFSPDGRTLAAGTQGGTVHLWDVADPAQATPLGDPLDAATDALTSVKFSPNGRVLVAGGYDTVVHRWDVTDPAAPVPLGEPLTGPDREVLALAFSPDGTTLAGGTGGEAVFLWQVAETSAEPVEVLTGPSGSGPVHSVAFSPNGRFFAAGSDDGRARLWNLARRQVTATLPHPGAVTGLVFEPNGQGVYATAADMLRRWRLPGPVMGLPAGAVRDLVHHPAAPIVAAASADGHLYLWDVTEQQRPELLSADPASPDEDFPLTGSLAISPDGRVLAATAHDGAIWRWDISEPREPVPVGPALRAPDFVAESLAFHPDGQIIAAGGPDGVALWDLVRPDRPTLRAVIPHGSVTSVAFDRHGQVLAAGGADRLVRLWDVSDPAAPTLLGEPLDGPAKSVETVVFSPDGTTLAVGSADETVRLFDMSDPAEPAEGPMITGPSGGVRDLAFAPDGRQLTIASRDHTLWIWNLHTDAAPTLHAVLTGPEGAVNGVAYGPDGRTLAASSSDTTVRLYYTDPADAEDLICAVAGDLITLEEWGQHVPGLPYRPPC